MYDKLVFKAYGTRNLNEAAEKFHKQTGKEAKVFVVRSDWDFFGSRENTEKVMVSRFGGYACISIPLYLGLDELKELEAIKKKAVKAVKKAKPSPEEEMLKRRLIAYTRYCNYCGRIYGTDPLKVVNHCGAPRCIQAHEDWLEHRAEIKRLHGSGRSNSGSSSSKKEKSDLDKENRSLLDFSLDNPNSPTVRGWIYLIEAENGLYKIGRSDDIEKRFGDLVNQSPVPLWLNHTIFCSNYARAETWLHHQFKQKRHHGEWFRLSEDEVEWITNLEDYSLDRA
jgi:hypothetical protein